MPANKDGIIEARICLGVIVGARGLKGDVRIKSYTDIPASIAAYGPVETDDGATLNLKVIGEAKGVVVARVSGVDDRIAADELKGQKLYVSRCALPVMDDKDEYYHADLVGLLVKDETGVECGTVIAMHDFGGGDLMEIRRRDGREILLPFTVATVPVIDVSIGRIVVSSAELVAATADAAPSLEEEEFLEGRLEA